MHEASYNALMLTESRLCARRELYKTHARNSTNKNDQNKTDTERCCFAVGCVDRHYFKCI
ncbi:hypothetical protein ALTERO38_60211 [Alteromonas sp. 38]|nr:hypothetical protein ALTERO38_60211 [Alteromonas sp. 38]